MKKIFLMAAMCCLVAGSAMFTSCTNTMSESDFFYTVALPDDATDAERNTFEVAAAPTIFREMQAISKDPTKPDRYFILHGTRKTCDAKGKAALDKAMNEIEAREGYNEVLLLGGIKVRFCYCDTETGEVKIKEDVYTRTFKK